MPRQKRTQIHASEVVDFPETQYSAVHEDEEDMQARIREINELRAKEAIVLASDPITLDNWNRHPMRDRRRQGVYSLRGSGIFVPGNKVAPDSLLTVLAPATKNAFGDFTWAKILCRCECGQEIEVSYAAAIQGKYSCGCARRQRKAPARAPKPDGTDYTGFKIEWHHRSVVVLGRMPTLGSSKVAEWQVCCGECAQIFTVFVETGRREWARLSEQMLLILDAGCKKCAG